MALLLFECLMQVIIFTVVLLPLLKYVHSLSLSLSLSLSNKQKPIQKIHWGREYVVEGQWNVEDISYRPIHRKVQGGGGVLGPSIDPPLLYIYINAGLNMKTSTHHNMNNTFSFGFHPRARLWFNTCKQ